MMLVFQCQRGIMINLRPYQKDAIEAIKETFKTEKRQYVEMPTGAGKTITFLSYASQNHKRILVIVPSKELLNQVYQTSLLFYHKNEISRKGNEFDELPQMIHICIINSVRDKYLDFINGQYFDLVIIDEAHHVQANSYKRLIESMVFSPKFLGVTATPDRADGQFIDEILYNKSFSIGIEQLINEGHLCDIEGYIVKTDIDLSDVDSHNGDFSIGHLYKKLATDTRNNLIVDICKNQMQDRKKLVFCINVKHAIEISNLLNEKGISSKAIYGKMKEDERQSILKAFRLGEITCLCNCQLLTEGFDEPSIDGIILARPTRSKALFIQMIGRGLRTSLGKENCKIIDIVDNHRQLAGFTSLLDNHKWPEIVSFKSLKDIKDHIHKHQIESIETKIERIDFFNLNYLDDLEILDCQNEYLEKNQLKYYGNLSFDEASFLIWHNELKKEYNNGIN